MAEKLFQRIRGILLSLLILLTAQYLCADNSEFLKVCIVANSDISGSADLAEKYAEARNIPKRNIIALPMGKQMLVKRNFYNEKIALPILEGLAKLGLINAVKKSQNAKAATDYVFLSSDIDFLVLCKGVPHGIASSDPQISQMRGGKVSSKSDAAAVDSELSMLLQGEYQLPGPRSNPLYNNTSKDAYKPLMILRTARIDGPSFKDAEAIFKRAILAEKRGFMGRIYIDKAKKGGADSWLESCAQTAKALGFDTDVDELATLMGYFDRRDGLCAYFGWYIAHPKEYFANKSLRFNEGAVGFHIYSYSALNISYPSEWAPALVSRGMSATVGNVYEPFLGTTHRPDIFFKNMSEGKTAGEAAYAALPSLSWQSIFIGDPLYRPFAKTLEEQISDVDSGNFSPEYAYAIIRKINLIESESGTNAALEFALKYADKFPSLVYSYKVATLYMKLKDKSSAMKIILPFFDGRKLNFSEQTLALDIAKNFLFPNGAYKECAIFGKKLVEENSEDKEFLKATLPFFIDSAKKASLDVEAEFFENKQNSLKENIGK